MALKIRLKRMGTKKKPFYRIVVADAQMPRDGRFVEKVGFYAPLSDEEPYRIDEDRVMHWLNQGAIPTVTVRSILRKAGVMEKWNVFGGKPHPFEENNVPAEVPQEPT